MFNRLASSRRAADRFTILAATTGLVMTGVMVLPTQIASANTTIVANCNDSGTGSLRAAVAAAGGGDSINFNLSPTCSAITLTSGDIEISKNLMIDGPGAGSLAVSGNSAGTVFVVDSGVTASISGLTVEDGALGVPGSLGTPGSFATGDGGGINNAGTLTLTNTTLSGNTAGSYGPGTTSSGLGGGIYNTGTLTVTDSTVSGNGSGTLVLGGGIYSTGALTITGSTISNNDAYWNYGGAGDGYGGGVYSTGALTITGSTISNNTAQAEGGGVESSGTMNLTDSTVSGNTAFDEGGAIAIVANSLVSTSVGTATISDSTISGNNGGYDGGGIYNGGTLTVTNSTFSGNTAPHPGGAGGGGIDSFAGSVSLAATIVADSVSGGDCSVSSAFTDGGYNLDDDGTCGLVAVTDLSDTNPQLDPSGLQSNGGPTQTIALEPGSPAIGALKSAPLCASSDQRGVVRPTPCDIGAFQTNVLPAVPVAAPDQYQTPLATELVISAPGILANDTLDGATIVSHTKTSHGALNLNSDGSFSYIPNPKFQGTDSFTYKIQNSAGSSTATVTIDVMPVPAGADLTVSISAPPCAKHGSSFQYTVKVTNNGPDRAIGVGTLLFLAPQLTFKSASKNPLSLTDELSWSVNSLAPRASLTYTVVVQVAKDVDTMTITGIAAVGATGSVDPNPLNNMASVTTTVSARWSKPRGHGRHHRH